MQSPAWALQAPDSGLGELWAGAGLVSHVPVSYSLQKQKPWGRRLAQGSSQLWPLLGSMHVFTVAWFQLVGRATGLFLDK